MIRFLTMAGLMISMLPAAILGQGKFLTNDGAINFYSHTVIEDIAALNKKVASVIDASSGELVIIVRMTEFQFEKKLMQEHFNENFVESEKYPKATFNGKIVNNSEIDYNAVGTYKAKVEGDLTIHGETNPVSMEGMIKVRSDGIIATTKFMLNPADYGIKIPRVVRKNISEQLEISAEMNYLPM